MKIADKAAIASIIIFAECIQAHPLSVASLPTGNYYYEPISAEASSKHSLFFRKSGFTIIGVEIQARNKLLCFRGIAKENEIVNVIRLFTEHSGENEFIKGKNIDLAIYQDTNRAVSDSEQEALRNCIHALWR